MFYSIPARIIILRKPTSLKFYLSILMLLPLAAFCQELPFDSASVSYASFFRACKYDSVLSLRTGKGYFPSLIHNLGYQATSPLRMKGRNFLGLAAVGAATVILIHYDQEIDDQVKGIKDE